MTKILLDTNILLWCIFKTKLSAEHLELISRADAVFVSAVSVLEIRIKQELGKLPKFDINKNIDLMEMTILPLDSTQSQSYQLHELSNKDPFDNVIISVALSENLSLMTSDRKILDIQNKKLKRIDART